MSRRSRLAAAMSASPVPAIAAGSWRAAGDVFAKLRRPPVTPLSAFNRTVQLAITGDGVAQTIVAASGIATLPIGPQGLGTRWYPQQVTIATQSGANDPSTCALYLNSTVFPPIGQSYAGGGDSIGLAVPPMEPGDLLIAVWSGAKPGDWASITVIGSKDALVA